MDTADVPAAEHDGIHDPENEPIGGDGSSSRLPGKPRGPPAPRRPPEEPGLATQNDRVNKVRVLAGATDDRADRLRVIEGDGRAEAVGHHGGDAVAARAQGADQRPLLLGGKYRKINTHIKPTRSELTRKNFVPILPQRRAAGFPMAPPPPLSTIRAKLSIWDSKSAPASLTAGG